MDDSEHIMRLLYSMSETDIGTMYEDSPSSLAKQFMDHTCLYRQV